ncbi:hypothetical protein K1719_041173 [Acacia pycnantha]|nr:hypothetical protein K1719_041173 [Acacia pycnantha]
MHISVADLVDEVSGRSCLGDEIADKVEHGERQETLTCPADPTINLDASQSGRSGDATNSFICETEGIPCPMVMDPEADNVFRGPINDTQELYSDSPRSDTKFLYVEVIFNRAVRGFSESFSYLTSESNPFCLLGAINQMVF